MGERLNDSLPDITAVRTISFINVFSLAVVLAFIGFYYWFCPNPDESLA